MTNSIPHKNPFPYQGTLSIEGKRFEFDSEVLGALQPTLLLDPIFKIREHTFKYLERFSASEKGLGQIVVLSGDHGSGKTHAIHYNMRQVSEYATKESIANKPIQVYAKAEGPDFLAIYRRIMVQVSYELLCNLVSRFIGVLTGEQLGKETGNRVAGEQVANRLREDPKQVYELFRIYLVEEGAVQERATKEIDRITGGIDDFQRALSYLLTPDLGTDAYDWLIGRPVTLDTTKMLGVSGPITSEEVGKWAIQLLVTLFNWGRQPLIIYIDQYEKLALDKDNNLISQNAGILHSLVEVIPRENCMLVLSGNKDAWQALSRDLKQRFGFNIVDFPVLTLKEAQELIYIYLFPNEEISNSPNKNINSDKALFPFTKGAVREVVRFSSGNIRRFLQISSAVFDAALPKQNIEPDLVTKVLKNQSHIYFDRFTVTREIEKLLNERALRFIKDFELEGARVDFAIVDAQSTPRLLIEIKQAIFHNDEARNALKSLNLIERVHIFGIPASFALIVLGYISPEVVNTINQFTQELVVYSPETFHTNFTTILDRVRPDTQEINGLSKNSETLERQLDEVRARLENLLHARDLETKGLENRLEQFLLQQAANRQIEQRTSARQLWADERYRIEERIRAVRAEHKKQHLDQLESLRAKAVDELKRRQITLLGMVIIITLIFAVTFLAMQFTMRPNFSFSEIMDLRSTRLFVLMFLTTVVFSSALIFFRFYFFTGSKRNELAAKISSIEELERLARSYISQSSVSSSTLLQSINPQIRFAGALKADPNKDFAGLSEALFSERSTLVRQAIARRIAESENLERIMKDKAISFLKEEAAILVEAAAERYMMHPSYYKELPRPLRTLAVISGVKPERKSSNNLVFQLDTAINAKSQISPKQAALVEVYDMGLDSYSGSELSNISESKVRQAVRDLSPFDEDGLGTYDSIKNINKIDRYYVFFRQLLFWIERGLLTDINNPRSV